VNMLRVWPIVWQFGIGGLLCLVGIWAGLRGGYLNLHIREDRRLLVILIGGYLLLLVLMAVFTFWAPYWSHGESL